MKPSDPYHPVRSPWSRLVEAVVRILRALGAVISRIGSAWGAFCLALVRRLPALSDQGEKSEGGSGRGQTFLVWTIVLLGLALAALCITQPFTLEGQVIFLSFMFFSMIALVRVKARITLMLLFVISIVVSGRYLWWRATATLKTNTRLELLFKTLLIAA